MRVARDEHAKVYWGSWRKTTRGIYFLHVAAVNVRKTCSPGVLNSRYSAGRSQIMYRVHHQSSQRKMIIPRVLYSLMTSEKAQRISLPQISPPAIMQFILQFNMPDIQVPHCCYTKRKWFVKSNYWEGYKTIFAKSRKKNLCAKI